MADAKDAKQSFVAKVTERGAAAWKKLSNMLVLDKASLTKKTGTDIVAKELRHKEREKEKALAEKRKAEAEEQRKLLQTDLATKAKQSKQANEAREKADAARKSEEVLIKHKKAKVKPKSLRELLPLGGVDLEPTVIYKRIFFAALITNLILTFISLGVKFFYDTTFQSFAGIGSYLGFMAALWTVWFIFLMGFYAACFTVYLDLLINKRRKEIEAVFPDFLQLAAANLSAGMTIDRALWSAIRPRFGVLAKEMEDVAKKTLTGYDLERALGEFSEKYDSLTLRRSTNLIVEGIHSGGRLADILNKIAVNMQENAILQKEMAANVTTYVIFISFASVAAAPFLFGLATQLLIVIKSIAGSISTEGGSGVGLSINPNVIKTSDFRIFAFTMLTISSVMSACIVSTIRKGSVKDGFRLIPFFWAITVALYFFAVWVLGGLFGGLTV